MVKKPIGYISYTHGLDGKVKIVPMVPCDEFENLIENNQPIFDDKGAPMEVSIFAFNGKVFLCRIEGVNDIDAAKKLTKHEIFIEVADDEYIDPETLMGKEIYDKQTKQPLGKVVDYGDFGGGMLVLAKNGKEETWHLIDAIMTI